MDRTNQRHSMSQAELMRQDWDARAQKDAFYYIASWRRGWSDADFLKSGEDDYQRVVAPFFSRQGFVPAGGTMLELGCGAGRMTHSFATRFRRVIACDVSGEMLARAEQQLSRMENIAWTQANGVDLEGVPSESVEFVFSYLVLQHLPDVELVHGYIREMFRVLKPSGMCLFQFNGTKDPTMNWKGRAAWGFLDGLSTMGLRPVARVGAKLFGLDEEMASKTWHGTPVPSEDIVQTVRTSNAAVLELQGENSPMAWCGAGKSRG
jgi:SAM-dependent methyltransferase